MTVIKIELIDPRAQILLEDLAKLNLIKIQEQESPQQRFTALLQKLRSKGGEEPILEDINKEVDLVRSERQNNDE